MKFRLELDVQKLGTAIDHHSRILLIGSCFTEAIGSKLKRHKFNVLENPAGILFNPVSVANTVIDCINKKTIEHDSLFNLNEVWHSWDHHSRFSSTDLNTSLQGINSSTLAAHSFLATATHLVITLGSAWTYQLSDEAALFKTERTVANNHKAPSSWFSKKLLSADKTVEILDNMLHQLWHFNPSLEIIFTISPVRHIKEGVVGNNRSKAVLIQAVHLLIDKFERLFYFPSYELVIDDLRDYRFYAEDLVHPNYQATEYVWEKLVQSTMSKKTQALLAEIATINLAYQHKAFNETSSDHKKFLQKFLEKTNHLLNQNPHLNFQKEINYFATQARNEE